MLNKQTAIRQEIFQKSLRLHLRCSDCNNFFVLTKDCFNPSVPITCQSCGAKDTDAKPDGSSVIEYFLTALAVQRWREGFTALNKRLPASGEVNQYARIPFWLMDWVAPVCSRFEWLVLERLIRFANPNGWCSVSQRTIAFWLIQFHPEGNHIPARQNVSFALKELWKVQIHHSRRGDDGKDLHSVRWLLIDQWGQKNHRLLKVQLDFKPGTKIISVVKDESRDRFPQYSDQDRGIETTNKGGKK